MNYDLLVNIVTGAILILGSTAIICFMLGVVSLVFNWALHRVVDNFWGVKNVCEYLIDKHKREQKEKYKKFHDVVM